MSIEGEDSSVISRLLRSYFGYGNNLSREERDDNPLSQTLWNYDKASWLLSQEGAQPGNEQWRWDGAGNPLDRHTASHIMHNRVTELNGIRWQYDIHGRTTEKDDGQTRWRYRYDGEHRLTDVISEPRDRNKPRTKVSFRYDPLGLSRCSTHKDEETPYGPATQSTAPEALAARLQVENGATLYRVGTTGRSETVGAQFWALEHPHSPGYANRYGIPQENVDRSNFLMTARLKPGAEFVTRPAPGGGENLGGGIEVVVPPDAVDIQNFNLF